MGLPQFPLAISGSLAGNACQVVNEKCGAWLISVQLKTDRTYLLEGKSKRLTNHCDYARRLNHVRLDKAGSLDRVRLALAGVALSRHLYTG